MLCLAKNPIPYASGVHIVERRVDILGHTFASADRERSQGKNYTV